jgi:hypothetical protein
MTANSFGSRATLRSGETDHVIYRLDAVDRAGSLPFGADPAVPLREDGGG